MHWLFMRLARFFLDRYAKQDNLLNNSQIKRMSLDDTNGQLTAAGFHELSWPPH